MMSRRVLGLALAAGLCAPTLGGCYKITYLNGPTAGAPTAAHEQWYHIGIFALVEFSKPVAVSQICPTGFSRVDHEISFVNGLIPMGINAVSSGLTSALGMTPVSLGWIYYPHTVRVYCSSGAAWDVELDGDGLATAAIPLGAEAQLANPVAELGPEAQAVAVPVLQPEP